MPHRRFITFILIIFLVTKFVFAVEKKKSYEILFSNKEREVNFSESNEIIQSKTIWERLGFGANERSQDNSAEVVTYKIIERRGQRINEPFDDLKYNSQVRRDMLLKQQEFYSPELVAVKGASDDWSVVGGNLTLLYDDDKSYAYEYLSGPDVILELKIPKSKHFFAYQLHKLERSIIRKYEEESGLATKREERKRYFQTRSEPITVNYLSTEKVVKAKFSEPISALPESDRNNWHYINDCMEQGKDCAIVQRANDDKTFQVYVTDQDRLNPKQFDQRLADAIKKFEDQEREQRRQAAEQKKGFWNRLLGR